MGSYFTKYNKKDININNELNKLIKEQVFNIIDENNDNIITKEEFNNWNKKMHSKIDKIKNKNKKIISQFEKTLEDKNKEIIELQTYIQTLEKTQEELQEANNILMESKPSNEQIKSIISKTKIRQYVKEILKNEKININGIPDKIEEAIYTNVIYIVMQLINNTTKNAELNVINHTFRIVVS